MRVRYSARAIRDLSNVLDYITERSTPGAQNVKRAIHQTIELIGDHPELGRSTGDADMRMVRVARYTNGLDG